VIEDARKIRYSDAYKEKGINVNFVEKQDDWLYIRTYERGVENETLSCGTGVTASVLAAAFTKQIDESGSHGVNTPGGMLTVQYEKNGQGFNNIWLEGEATFVFKGEINIL
jgi:diaminopimelate epimerase